MKARLHRSLCCLLAGLFVIVFTNAALLAQSPSTAPQQDPSSVTVWSIAGADVVKRMNIIASDSLAGRRTGEEGATKAARYIAGEFKRLGLSPIDAAHDYYQHFEFSEHAMDTTRHGMTQAMNIVGMLPGYDASLRDQVVVIGAHYDHLGMGGMFALDPSVNAIHYGADDNGSGTVGLLELAEYFTMNRTAFRRSIVFIAFSGEEEGLFGSKYFVDHPLVPLKNIQAMINMDMIGRLSEDSILILEGIGTSPIWTPLVKGFNNPSQFSLRLKQTGRGPSDHASFYSKDIPVLFFFTGFHPDYHKATDTRDKINAVGEARVVELAMRIADSVANMDDRIPFTKVAEDTNITATSWSVYVGGVPDYGYEGEGLRISEITENSPALKAGLHKGDVIVKFGDMAIKNIYDYTNALSKHKPDDVVPFMVKRETGTMTIPVTLGKRARTHD